MDFLTKKSKVNEGEVPQYYIEESHPAIIVPEEFELVQAELLRRQKPTAAVQWKERICCPACLRRLRKFLRSKGLAFQQQVSAGDLAVQS